MIEKKIGSKFLYVFLMCFASLVLSLLLFPVSSQASSNFPNKSDLQNYLNDYFGTNITLADNFYNSFVSVTNNNPSYSISFKFADSARTFCYVSQYSSGNNSSYTISGNYYYGNVQTDTIGSVSYGSLSFNNGLLFSDLDTFLAEFNHIDWNNPYYSANIPNPNMYVSYRNLSSTPVIDVPLNVSVSSFPVGQNVNEYYVQMFALVNMDFNYYVQNSRDGIVYNGLDMEKWTTYFDVVTPQDYKTASDLSEDYIHLALTNGWYSNYPQDSSFNFSFADGIPSNLQSSAITKFHNFRKNATFADNTVYLYVRYFTIDEENNFVVGPWTVWKSYNPNEFYAELPSYYVPYNIVPGTQGTSSNVTPVSTASPEPSVIVNPVNTNPGVNITVQQNVPNYPDYPTIASYNKDNLLVDTMNQLTSIQGFFGEFGSFLVAAFAFMPAWIWAIIGVGFSLSIVVMFLKIL